MTILHIAMVGLGGFFGALARYFISKLNNKSPLTIPIGTLIVNLSGAFFLGMITGAKANVIGALLLGTGFMGAFTTFSTFNLELTRLSINQRIGRFILYIVMTYGLGILLASLGYLYGTSFFR